MSREVLETGSKEDEAEEMDGTRETRDCDGRFSGEEVCVRHLPGAQDQPDALLSLARQVLGKRQKGINQRQL